MGTVRELLRTKHFVVFLVAVFAVHFGYALIHQIPPSVDARAYDTIAYNLATIGEYKLGAGLLNEMDPAIFKIGPGYEWWLAGVYIIFGRNLWLVWVLQSLMYTATIGVLAALAAAIFNKTEKINWPAVYAGAAPAAFFVDVIQLTGMLMGETLFIFVTALVMAAGYVFWERPLMSRAVILGFLLGMLYLIRPVGVAFILAFVVAMLMRRFYKEALVAVVVVAVMQMPWIWRNYQVYGAVLPTHTTAGGVDVLSGNYPGNHGEYRSDFPLYKEIEAANPTPVEFNRAGARWLANFAMTELGRLVGVWTEKAIIFWGATKTGGFWFHYFNSVEQAVTVALSALFYIFIYGAAGAYVLARRSGRRMPAAMKTYLIAAAGLFLISVVTIVSSRYRLTLLPVAALASAGFFYEVWPSIYRYRYAAMAGVLMMAATGVDAWLQWEKVGERIAKIWG